MNCRIIYKDNKIDHVQAENGERSNLFDSLKDIFGAEKALELYALTEEDGYKQKIQEKVRSFVGITEKQIDKLSEVIDAQETLNKLVETGLADNVYQMTSEEIEAKLVELGVEADVAKQVVAYHGSARKFNKFSSDKIGTGVKAMRTGAGFYFTKKESRAKGYARQLSDKTTFTIGDEVVKEGGMFTGERYSIIEDIYNKVNGSRIGFAKELLKLSNSEKNKGREERVKYLESAVKNNRLTQEQVEDGDYDLPIYVNLYFNDSFDYRQLAKKVLKSGVEKNQYPSYLYSVVIQESGNWIDFKKPVDGELYDKILIQAEKENSSYLDKIKQLKGKNGKEFYFGLVPTRGTLKSPEQEVSEFLMRAGIDGNIGYEDTDTEYVVFDENAITIEEQIQFQKSGITPITNGFIYKNDVYLNKNADESTMVHEFNHLYNNWLKQNRPEVYKKGLDLVKAELGLRSVNYELKRPSENKLIFVDPTKLLERLDKDDPSYSILDKNNQIGNRVEKAKDYLNKYLTDQRAIDPRTGERTKSILNFEPSLVSIYDNKLGFTDGRHRVLAAKELGLREVGIEIPIEQENLFKDLLPQPSEIQDIIDFVKTNQPKLEGDALLEEILTEMVGRRGLELLNEQKDKAKSSGIIDYLKQVWQEIKNMLGLSSYTDEQILNINLQDFANASAVDLLREERLGTFSEESNDIRYQIIGEKGASKIKEYSSKLNSARELEKQGESIDEIANKTGWYKQNNQWKYLAPELLKQLTIKDYETNKVYKLQDILQNKDTLLQMYPEMADIKVVFYDNSLQNAPKETKNWGNSLGAYNAEKRVLGVNTNIRGVRRSIAEVQRTLGHEFTHLIQGIEGFPIGGHKTSVIFEANRLLGLNVKSTIGETFDAIESRDKSKFTKAQNKIIEDAKQTGYAIVDNNIAFLNKQYKQILGEIDANVVEDVMKKLQNREQITMPYNQYLQIFAQENKIDLDNTYLLSNGDIQFSLTSEIKKSTSLKIEVKEVNGRLVVEPLVNGTKAGALRMLPYEDGYRVDSVVVYDKYQNKRLGTRLYQEAIKFLLKSQTPLYSLKVRSENAKKIWDKFVAIGVAQKVDEDYIAPNKGGLDKNNEAKPSDVMQYANTTDEKLSKEETAEAIDLTVSLGVESSQEAVAILKDAFLENDAFVFDKKKMKKAGYNDYEITKILTDVNLQNQIKNNVAKLENTDFSAPLMDVQTSPEIGIFGKQKVKPKVKTVNVKTVNEQGEVVDKVSDTKELLRKTYPDTLPNDMPQIASSLLKSSENVVNTYNDLFYNTLDNLKDAALDLGVDLKDIENRVFPLENFKSFVNSLMEYYANPSDAFAEVYDEFFENYGAEKATKPTMSTPYTEYELFDKFNLVRNGDEYVKVEDVEIEPSAERQAKIPQLEVEDFAVDFDKLEKLVYHKEQLGAEMKTLQKPLVEEINLREVKKNPYLKATSEGVKLVSEDPLTAQKAELYGYEPKVAEKQPKKIETDYSLVQDVLVTQLTYENKVRTPKGNFTKFMDDNNKSVFLLDGSKQSTVDLEGYLSKADNTPKIKAKKLYSKEEYEENFGCL